jgi:uncharacterized protein YciI
MSVPYFYMALCYDAPGRKAQEKRAAHLAAHLAYVERIMAKIALGGPLRSDDNKTSLGTLIIYKTQDRKEAEALLANDPFYAAGLWRRTDIVRLNGAAGQWVGGRRW